MKKFISLLLVFFMLTSVAFAQSGTVDWTKKSSQGERLGGHISVGQRIELWRYDEKTWRHEDITLTQKQMNDLLSGKLEGKGLRTGSSTTRVDLPKEVKDYLKKGGKTEDIEVIFQSTNFDKLSLRQDQIYYQDPKYKITDEHIEVTIYPIFNVHREPIYGSRFDPNMKIDIPQPLGNYGYSAYSIFDKNGNNIGSTTSDYLTPDMIKDHKGYLHSGHTIKVGEMGNYNKTYKSEDIRIGWGDLNTGGAIGLGFRYPMLVAFYVKEGTNLIAEELTTTYDTPTETLKVKGKIRYLGKEDLDKTEVEFIWSTNDNQNGSKVIELKDLKPDKTFNVDIEVPIKNNPDKKVEGTISMEVNPKKDIEELNYNDNKLEEKFVLPIEDLDFWITTNTNGNSENEDVTIPLTVGLENSDKDLKTTINIYDNVGKQVLTKEETIKVGSGNVINVTIDKGYISQGQNVFYGVVNSDFNLTKGNPIEEENLTNNITEISILGGEKVEGYSNSCGFGGKGDSGGYEVLVCDDEGNCWCEGRSTNLYHNVDVEFIEYGMYSNEWSNDLKGQNFRPNAVKGKDLSGNPAYDELMALMGYNPLGQIIRAGHGINVKGVIKVKGTVQGFDSHDHSWAYDFVEDLKKNTFTSGKSSHAGIKDTRNNEGNFTQRMEEDTSRSGSQNFYDHPYPQVYGSSECTQLEKYTSDFEFTIPIVISHAKGYIDTLNVNKKSKVPNERKWFVYINEPDGDYSLKLTSNLNPKALGVHDGQKTTCEKAPNEFKFSVFETIYSMPNVIVNDNREWDN